MTDGKTALDELKEISSQIESAVLFGADGAVVASTLPALRAKQVAASAKALFEGAGRTATGDLTHLEAATGDGSLFIVREGDLFVAAATGVEPTAGLVFYDLKACLRKAAEKPKPKPRAKPKSPTKPKAAAKPRAKPTRPKSNGKS
jgi:predicted regulator of Ras-like GTPase activity (Roadblock/LC7/MglB family)